MRIGYACAYTPLPLIDALRCEPFRILPMTDASDQAGRVIHDNMCPHVKRILDRAMEDDLPELDAVVFVNSCDAMRRLSDGWQQVRPRDRVFLFDLPPSADQHSMGWVAAELERLRDQLAEWAGCTVSDDDLNESVDRYDELAAGLEQARGRLRAGTLPGGSSVLQRVHNEVSACSLSESLDKVRQLLAQPPTDPKREGVPIHLFGNVLSDPAAFELIEECGARIVSDDLCTGSRLIHPIRHGESFETPIQELAAAMLSRPACARTFRPSSPGQLGSDLVEQATQAGAKAVIAHIIKFCDPYMGRMPAVRHACAEASLPLLVLEGDCTLRSMGQQTTRIEALVEMMEMRS